MTIAPKFRIILAIVTAVLLIAAAGWAVREARGEAEAEAEADKVGGEVAVAAEDGAGAVFEALAEFERSLHALLALFGEPGVEVLAWIGLGEGGERE